MKLQLGLAIMGVTVMSFAQTLKPNDVQGNIQPFLNEQTVQQEMELYSRAFGLEENSSLDKEDAGPCAKLTLTEDQMKSIKNALIDFKQEMITAKAAIEVAGLEYLQTVIDLESTKDQATAAVMGVGTHVATIVIGALNFKNKILYDILTVDQRYDGLGCMHHVQKMMEMKKLKEICSKVGGHHPKPIPPKPGSR